MRMFTVKMRLPSEEIKTVRILLLLFSASLVSGCTIPVTGILFNNSNSQIIAKMLLDGNETLQIKIAPKTSAKLKGWLLHDVRVLFEGREYRYDRAYPGSDFVVTSGFGPFVDRRVYLEFESDGRIFVVKSNAQFGESPSIQPSGFPLIGT